MWKGISYWFMEANQIKYSSYRHQWTLIANTKAGFSSSLTFVPLPTFLTTRDKFYSELLKVNQNLWWYPSPISQNKNQSISKLLSQHSLIASKHSSHLENCCCVCGLANCNVSHYTVHRVLQNYFVNYTRKEMTQPFNHSYLQMWGSTFVQLFTQKPMRLTEIITWFKLIVFKIVRIRTIYLIQNTNTDLV